MAKNKRRISDDEYIIIPRWAITQLGLRGAELNVFGLIYAFTKRNGTLKGGLSYIAEWLGVAKPRVSANLNSLINKGAVIRAGDFYGRDANYELCTTKCYQKRNFNVTENVTKCYEKRNVNVTQNVNSTIKRNIKEKYIGNINTPRACAREKEQINEHVFLYPEERDKLISEYGEQGLREIADILDAHKLKTGAEYASDYGAIRDWVIERYERKRKSAPKRKEAPRKPSKEEVDEEEQRSVMRLREIMERKKREQEALNG